MSGCSSDCAESVSAIEHTEQGGRDHERSYQRQRDIQTHFNPSKAEYIDFFHPLVARGCVEPCIDLAILKALGKQEIKSRQLKHNGRLCQKTYHRLLVRRK